MTIGMTYDLRSDYLAEGFSLEETAEFDRDETIRALQDALDGLGYRTQRIGNIRSLARRLAAGDRWDLVFNVCEGLYGSARESQAPALLDAYNVPYTMSDPMVLTLTLHKGLAKLVVREAGIPTADFAVVNEQADAARVSLPFPLFAKPACEGTGKGIDGRSRVESEAALGQLCSDLLERYRQPVLVETYLPGREFTVGIAGNGSGARVLGSMEVIFHAVDEGEIYGYLNKEESEERMSYLPGTDAAARSAEDVALRSYRALGCRDVSRVDIRFDAGGTPCFMEVNPLPGLHPDHSDLPMLCRYQSIDYQRLIGIVVEEAMTRLGMSTHR
ncbi:MAG TPA: D-alanine--D-alanine ligase [Spirochaetia bacterium]|nr:D-alanine--D-alanine ligase [Spirochaetia bacterium]